MCSFLRNLHFYSVHLFYNLHACFINLTCFICVSCACLIKTRVIYKTCKIRNARALQKQKVTSQASNISASSTFEKTKNKWTKSPNSCHTVNILIISVRLSTDRCHRELKLASWHKPRLKSDHNTHQMFQILLFSLLIHLFNTQSPLINNFHSAKNEVKHFWKKNKMCNWLFT